MLLPLQQRILKSMKVVELLPIILIWVSGISFIYYGFSCLFIGSMTKEFEGYGLTRFRKLVGLLEILGGLGSLIGLLFPYLLIFSSAGLALLMLMGVIVRLRIKDPIIQIIPAFSLMVINIYILIKVVSIV